MSQTGTTRPRRRITPSISGVLCGKTENAAGRHKFGDLIRGQRETALAQTQQNAGVRIGCSVQVMEQSHFRLRESAGVSVAGSAMRRAAQFLRRSRNPCGIHDGNHVLIQHRQAAIPRAFLVAERAGQCLEARHGGHFLDAVHQQRDARFAKKKDQRRRRWPQSKVQRER